MRIELHFMGSAGLAVGRALAAKLTEQLDVMERWKKGVGEFANGKGGQFSEGCGVGIDVPPEIRVTIDTADWR